MKCIWVAAHFKEVGSWRTKSVQMGTENKTIEKGFFKKRQVEEEVPIFEERREWVMTGVSDCDIDGERFSKDIGTAINALEVDGFEIVSITPVLCGSYKFDVKAPVINAADRASYGWGYGFSYTSGATVVARLRTLG